MNDKKTLSARARLTVGNLAEALAKIDLDPEGIPVCSPSDAYWIQEALKEDVESLVSDLSDIENRITDVEDNLDIDYSLEDLQSKLEKIENKIEDIDFVELDQVDWKTLNETIEQLIYVDLAIFEDYDPGEMEARIEDLEKQGQDSDNKIISLEERIAKLEAIISKMNGKLYEMPLSEMDRL